MPIKESVHECSQKLYESPNWKQWICSLTDECLNNNTSGYGILLSNKEEWTIDTYNLDESLEYYYAEWKKLAPKGHIYFHLYDTP
jgi:hypothetical protein